MIKSVIFSATHNINWKSFKIEQYLIKDSSMHIYNISLKLSYLVRRMSNIIIYIIAWNHIIVSEFVIWFESITFLKLQCTFRHFRFLMICFESYLVNHRCDWGNFSMKSCLQFWNYFFFNSFRICFFAVIYFRLFSLREAGYYSPFHSTDTSSMYFSFESTLSDISILFSSLLLSSGQIWRG